jgi:translation initiation factor 4G
MAADKRFQGAKPETTATSTVANSVSTVSTADRKSKEAIQRTGSFKDNKKNAVKKESRNTSQLPKACYFLLVSF